MTSLMRQAVRTASVVTVIVGLGASRGALGNAVQGCEGEECTPSLITPSSTGGIAGVEVVWEPVDNQQPTPGQLLYVSSTCTKENTCEKCKMSWDIKITIQPGVSVSWTLDGVPGSAAGGANRSTTVSLPVDLNVDCKDTGTSTLNMDSGAFVSSRAYDCDC